MNAPRDGMTVRIANFRSHLDVPERLRCNVVALPE